MNVTSFSELKVKWLIMSNITVSMDSSLYYCQNRCIRIDWQWKATFRNESNSTSKYTRKKIPISFHCAVCASEKMKARKPFISNAELNCKYLKKAFHIDNQWFLLTPKMWAISICCSSQSSFISFTFCLSLSYDARVLHANARCFCSLFTNSIASQNK